MQQLNRLADWINRIGCDQDDNDEVALAKRIMVGVAVWPAPAGVVWGAVYLAAGAGPWALIPMAYLPLALVNTAMFGVTRHLGFFRTTQLFLILIIPWLLVIGLGGFASSGAAIVWSALCPLSALLVGSGRQALGWLAAFVALLVVGAVAQPLATPADLDHRLVASMSVLNVAAVTCIVFVMLGFFVQQRDHFQRRSEALLANILPEEIARALKDEHRTIADHYDAVSVLFADIVDFTSMAEQMTPRQLVDLLNEVFQCFDDLVGAHGVEKVKTIGDAYMAAAGVPMPRADHATVLIDLALDMQQAVKERDFGGERLTLRIGINSGPVVAGVIGHKKFSYDLWGDAVNVASRMESRGRQGAIQITRATYDLVKDRFTCIPIGPVRIKDNRHVDAWHVTGRR